MDRYRFILGSIIVLGMMILAVAIALGHVEEKSSYGLTAIMAILAKVVLDFSDFAFKPRRKDDDTPTKGDPPI